VVDVMMNEGEWRAREAAHRGRLSPWVEAHRSRRAGAVSHPVIDFLFTYYSFRPGQLLRWSPGVGVVLEDPDAEWAGRKHFVTKEGSAGLDLGSMSDRERGALRWIGDLLAATAGRPGRFGCFGLHEWAMVYRLSHEEVRHSKFRLRLSPEEIAAAVEAAPLCCTHYDAFRFFTPPARPLNTVEPSLDSRIDLEQPGCLHTNMDLYKWAYKLSPWVPSELIADAFLLAAEIREVDMRASPYDLSEIGYEPIAIETVEGREEYERLQRGFAERAGGLRERLLGCCSQLEGALSNSE
jgi:hypothetical protein